jgi:hypothetical protein
LVLHWLLRKGLIRSRIAGEAMLSTVVV